MSHTQRETEEFKGQLVQNIEWKHTNGQKDMTFPANAVGKKRRASFSRFVHIVPHVNFSS